MKKRPALLSAIGFAFVLLAILGISLTAQAAQVIDVPRAPNASALRISQLFGGGGNAGAPYRYDFVELFNAGATAVDISNWSLQYGAQAGVLGGSTGANIYAFPVSTTIPAGRYLLVQLAGGATGVTFTADLTTTVINMSGSNGKIALANTTTWLNCGGVGNLCTLPDPRIVDLVSYGNITTTAEITSVNYPTALTNSQGALRLNNGCQDTDNNFNDFSVVVSPTLSPRNSASPVNVCGGPSGSDLSLLKSGPTTANAGDPITYTISLSNTGTATATLSVLTDTLPTQVSFVTYTTASAVTFTHPSATQLVWELGDILTTTPEITIQVQGVITTNITNGTVVTNTATASTASAESNTANTAQVSTTISSTVLPDVEVYVQKTTPTAVVFGGELVTYTIVYGNDGTQLVTATLTDTLPISFTVADIAFNDGPPNPIDNTNTRSWTATLASGDRFTFTLALTVPTSIVNGTLITNTIEITATGSGNNPLNDLSSASSTVYQIVPISAARAGTNGQVFAVEGQVIYAPNTFGTNEWGVQDASGGISVFYSPAPVATLGDRVRLVATRGAFNNQEQLAAPVYYFANLGSAPQVQPLPYTTGQVASGSTEGWLSVITGTVSGLPACTGNYQFNINDGSGSTVVFVDQDTAVNVCALGVVNGDRIVVTGFSTQFGAAYEVKPRFPADVKRLFDVTFVYNDLEDVVQPGEDVQLRGDFTNWGTNPITMAHDAGYTVFSTTVTLPTTATQNYKYFVAVGSGGSWDWLNNTATNRVITPTLGVQVQNDYRRVFIGWGNLQWPPTINLNLGASTPDIYGRLWVDGVTTAPGAGRSLRSEVGYGTNPDPANWSWSGMVFNADDGPNNDEYRGVITPTAGGVYSYATRYNGNWGVGNPNSLWVYADLDGIPFSLDKTGVLTVTAPQLAINKAVATANAEVQLGEVVTYTFTLSNTGDGTATSVLITDVLPTAVNFGGFVQQNGAAYSSGAITWSGSLNAGASATVIFTTTVKNDQSLYGTDVMNTVQFTSGNGGSGSTNIAFAVVKHYFLYLPVIKR